ncbi:hypothetical protein JKP88DRAFT_281998 [Tribonema minus]|uniref:Complex 1 LYR protein domain-containing protein n=1 Tax=Tribonema minus TaxID=303371 RepID=A0A836C988_9STRA|nr:hypothetical protein JKP88DRAFT_281998 [Tribonema minus]
MRPQVRDLYKRFLIVGVDYPHPEGMAFVRRKVKEAFRENAHLTHEATSQTLTHVHNSESQADVNRAVGRGRRVCKDIVGFIQLKKYRAMRERYGIKEEDKAREAEAYDFHAK